MENATTDMMICYTKVSILTTLLIFWLTTVLPNMHKLELVWKVIDLFC